MINTRSFIYNIKEYRNYKIANKINSNPLIHSKGIIYFRRKIKMEIVASILQFASAGVAVYGASIGINGLTTYSEGKSQHAPGKQDEGMSKIVGGIFIIVVGVVLVPIIGNYFNGLGA